VRVASSPFRRSLATTDRVATSSGSPFTRNFQGPVTSPRVPPGYFTGALSFSSLLFEAQSAAKPASLLAGALSTSAPAPTC
jgi:hypothetical protein